MGTPIIPHSNPALILDPPEHDLDFVPLLVEGFAVAVPYRSVLAWWNAWCDTLLLEGGDEPIRIIPAVGNQMCGRRKVGQQASRASVIAGVPGGQ